MKKMIRKGFSMIELLFVMVILAALSAIAIPSMSGGKEAAILTSMKSDAKNLISNIHAEKIKVFEYDMWAVLGEGLMYDQTTTSQYFDKNTGIYKSGLDIRISLSNGNSFWATPSHCATDAEGYDNGFDIGIYNKDLPNKRVQFDSCVDSTLKVVNVDLAP